MSWPHPPQTWPGGGLGSLGIYNLLKAIWKEILMVITIVLLLSPIIHLGEIHPEGRAHRREELQRGAVGAAACECETSGT